MENVPTGDHAKCSSMIVGDHCHCEHCNTESEKKGGNEKGPLLRYREYLMHISVQKKRNDEQTQKTKVLCNSRYPGLGYEEGTEREAE